MITSDHSSIRVLHVLGSLNRGGVESWLMHVLRHIERNTYQFDFCCLIGEEGVYAAEAKSLGSHVFPIKLTKNLPRFNRRFSRLLQERQYDVVHSHVHQFSGYILRQAARGGIQSRIAHSFTAPGKQTNSVTRRAYLALMGRWLTRYATVGLGNSTESMISLFGPDWQSNPQRKLVYCGIDLDLFKQPASTMDSHKICEKWDIPETALIVGHVGRLTPAKNHRFALEIAAAMQQLDARVWFLFVGDGPLRAEMEGIARENGLRQVVFTGIVEDVTTYLKSMDLFLFPSLWEGLPQSVIEAQAVGLRCLCSDAVTREVVVVPEAVQFLPLDLPVVEWAERIKAMLEAPGVDTQMAWESVAASPFAIENSVLALTQIYRESLA
jgi:glycosyltransferase involved in cell wall biosynthesis